MSSSNRKVYLMGDMSLREFFSAPTRYLAESISKESEFEKPYLDDDRGKMHADFPWPDWPTMPPIDPWPPWTPPDGPVPGLPGCAILCYSPGGGDCDEPVWCHPGIWCGQDIGCTLCSWVVEGATIGYTPHGSGVGSWGIDVWIDQESLTDGKALIEVCMTDPCKNVCCEEVEVTCKVCPPDIVISWDSDLNLTMGQDDGVSVYIKDGVAPYSWSVTGTGFSLNTPVTYGVANVLNSDNTACGTATITVTDFCGDTTTGYVRCTAGSWQEVDSCQPDLGGGYATRTIGKFKREEWWCRTCPDLEWNYDGDCGAAMPHFGSCADDCCAPHTACDPGELEHLVPDHPSCIGATTFCGVRSSKDWEWKC